MLPRHLRHQSGGGSAANGHLSRAAHLNAALLSAGLDAFLLINCGEHGEARVT